MLRILCAQILLLILFTQQSYCTNVDSNTKWCRNFLKKTYGIVHEPDCKNTTALTTTSITTTAPSLAFVPTYTEPHKGNTISPYFNSNLPLQFSHLSITQWNNDGTRKGLGNNKSASLLIMMGKRGKKLRKEMREERRKPTPPRIQTPYGPIRMNSPPRMCLACAGRGVVRCKVRFITEI